ncbi:unnamed protein product [Scytosiphon promiscuus]
MTHERLTVLGAVLVVLISGRAGALSMVAGLTALRTCRSSRAAISTAVALHQQKAHRCHGRGTASTLGSRSSAKSRAGALVWTLPMASRAMSLVPEGSRRDRDEASREGESHSGSRQPSGPNGAAAAGTTLARLAPAEEPWLTEGGARLRAGELVAFPTETVYGLGANALSEEAVLKIFQAKQRPLTDPLIVHVPDTASALAVVDFEGEGGGGAKARRLLDLLGEKLWPGPLTLIVKAAEVVPACVTAGTGFVGVRCPAHPTTRQLLSLAGVPVAAPSANRFGHVSPTQAAHVLEDLGGSDILILDGDASGACGVGIESTVAKIDAANDRILILRMGGTTQERIREALKEGGEEFSGTSVHAGSVAGGKAEAKAVVEEEEEGNGSSIHEPAEDEGQAPGSVIPPVIVSDIYCTFSRDTGQLLRHYSPDLEVIRVLGVTPGSTASGRIVGTGDVVDLLDMARTSVVVDFAGQLKGLQPSAMAYSDLSVEGSADEAAEGLFRALRWAERQPSAHRLLIAGLPSTSSGDLAAAVNDRIFRSASGKTISAE